VCRRLDTSRQVRALTSRVGQRDRRELRPSLNSATLPLSLRPQVTERTAAICSRFGPGLVENVHKQQKSRSLNLPVVRQPSAAFETSPI
jgi:hypothetical protein